jgi:preprotein translocase subunit SecE
MQTMANPVFKVREFLREVVVELKKSAWPTRSDLVDSTLVVIITVLVLGMFVAFADVVFVGIVGILTKSA